MKKFFILALILLLAAFVSACQRTSSAGIGNSAALDENGVSASAAGGENVPPSVDGDTANVIWSGEWKRLDTGRFNSATLIILKETKHGFDFKMEAFSGGNMGFLNGTATIDGTKAYYKDNGTGAELIFNLKDGRIELTANDAANGQAGAGVWFDGKYTKGKLPEDTLLSLDYVTSQVQDDAFKAMAGKDYELFLDTAQIRDDMEDLDGYGAKVYHWWVRGFAGTYESMVMLLPDGKICAAVIDPSTEVVKVYSNASYITDTPKSFKTWIEQKGFSVEFNNTDENE